MIWDPLCNCNPTSCECLSCVPDFRCCTWQGRIPVCPMQVRCLHSELALQERKEIFQDRPRRNALNTSSRLARSCRWNCAPLRRHLPPWLEVAARSKQRRGRRWHVCHGRSLQESGHLPGWRPDNLETSNEQLHIQRSLVTRT
jgi:hypothetical protein